MKAVRALALGSIAVAVVVVALYAWFGPSTVRVPTGAMLPTIRPGDGVFVSSRHGAPARGDIVVFRHPFHPTDRYVKRVVAVGGDRVLVRGTQVFVNDVALAERRVLVTEGESENTYREVGVEGAGSYSVYYLRDAHRDLPFPSAASYGVSVLPTIEEVVEDNLTVARDVLKTAVDDAPGLSEVPVDVIALPGAPARVLVEQAQGAALLVVGHRGRGGFKSAVLGSVGMHCVLHATCPVTVVRPQQEPADAPRIESVEPVSAPVP